MSDKRKVILQVGGKDFALITSEPREYILRLEEMLNRRLNETAMAVRAPVSAASLPTMISLADDLLKSQEENSRLRRQLQQLREGTSAENE